MAEDKLQEMSFWDHVDALRSVLIRIVVVLVLLTIGLFALMPSSLINSSMRFPLTACSSA